MPGLRQRALEAHALRETQMADYDRRDRDAKNAKLQRKGARLLRRKFDIDCRRSDIVADEVFGPFVDVDGCRLRIAFDDHGLPGSVHVVFDGRPCRDLADLGRVIARAELLANR